MGKLPKKHTETRLRSQTTLTGSQQLCRVSGIFAARGVVFAHICCLSGVLESFVPWKEVRWFPIVRYYFLVSTGKSSEENFAEVA
jgi:hypothetical protein